MLVPADLGQPPLFLAQVVVKTVLTKLDGGLGAQVRAADPDNHQHFALLLYPFRSSFDAFELSPVIFSRKV